jgi:hypothetical protein
MLSFEPMTPLIFVGVVVTFVDHERFKVPVRRYPDFRKVCGGYFAMKRWPSAVTSTMSKISFFRTASTSLCLALAMTFALITIT